MDTFCGYILMGCGERAEYTLYGKGTVPMHLCGEHFDQEYKDRYEKATE